MQACTPANTCAQNPESESLPLLICDNGVIKQYNNNAHLHSRFRGSLHSKGTAALPFFGPLENCATNTREAAGAQRALRASAALHPMRAADRVEELSALPSILSTFMKRRYKKQNRKSIY